MLNDQVDHDPFSPDGFCCEPRIRRGIRAEHFSAGELTPGNFAHRAIARLALLGRLFSLRGGFLLRCHNAITSSLISTTVCFKFAASMFFLKSARIFSRRARRISTRRAPFCATCERGWGA